MKELTLFLLRRAHHQTKSLIQFTFAQAMSPEVFAEVQRDVRTLKKLGLTCKLTKLDEYQSQERGDPFYTPTILAKLEVQ